MRNLNLERCLLQRKLDLKAQNSRKFFIKFKAGAMQWPALIKLKSIRAKKTKNKKEENENNNNDHLHYLIFFYNKKNLI